MIQPRLISEIAECASLDDLDKLLFRVLAFYGVGSFNYGIKVPCILQSQAPYIHSGYDPEWISHYVSRQYHLCDPTVAYAMQNLAPAIWDDSHFLSNPSLRAEASDAGLSHGATYPIRGLAGEAGLFCIAEKTPIPKELFIGFCALAPAFHLKIVELDAKAKIPHLRLPELTRRESEYLHWLCAGKNMEEIAKIMSISYRTCVDYGEKLMRKFGCPSKSAVVALAIARNMVRL